MPRSPAAPAAADWREHLSRGLALAIEALLYLMVVGAPWAFGAIDSHFEAILYFGLAALLVLWCLRWLISWRLEWRWDPVPLVLAAMLLLGLIQALPLPRGWIPPLSPMAAKLYAELLPARPEQLPPGGTPIVTPQPPGSTLSLYPAGTRHFVLQLMAVLLVYCVARNNLSGLASLRRLAWVSVLNGVALGFMALLQHFTSPPNVIYWTYNSPGTSFGPFVCRNHFPFYMNVCLGLGLGLVLAVRAKQPGYQVAPSVTEAGRRGPRPIQPAEEAAPAGVSDLMQTPWALWVAAGLVLMLASVIMSLSRGGLSALLIGLATLIVLRLATARSWQWLAPVFAVAAAAGLLLLWLGFDLIESRYQSLWRGEVFTERWLIWQAAWEAAQDFLLTGAGGGVFAYLEPLYRPEAADPRVAGTYVHNEYLEALVEGGIPRLVLTLLLVVLVLRSAWRAVRACRGRAEQGLALGGMVGLVAYIVHSAGDFGVHVPALALQVTVLAALLADVAGSAPRPDQASNEQVTWSASWFGLAPLVGTVMVGTMAVLLGITAYRQQVTRTFVAAALQRYADKTSKGMLEAASLLRAGLFYSPEYARYRLEFALALHRALELRATEDLRIASLSEAANVLVALSGGAAPVFSPPQAWAGFMVASGPASFHLQRVQVTRAEGQLRGVLLAVLAQIVAVRDQCPLLLQPHLRLAELASYFAAADAKLAYLQRAKRLRVFDPYVWFQCGMQEWLDEQYETALSSFRHCLELPNASPYFLPILEQVATQRPAEEFLTRVVHHHPAFLFVGTLRIFSQPEQAEKRQPYLQRALDLLRRKSDEDTTADDWRLQALILQELKQPAQAEECFLKALFRAPRQHEWRLELARLYLEQEQFAKAQAAVETVVAHQPNHAQARDLLKQLRELQRLRTRP